MPDTGGYWRKSFNKHQSFYKSSLNSRYSGCTDVDHQSVLLCPREPPSAVCPFRSQEACVCSTDDISTRSLLHLMLRVWHRPRLTSRGGVTEGEVSQGEACSCAGVECAIYPAPKPRLSPNDDITGARRPHLLLTSRTAQMPADMMEKTSSSPVAATPASMNTTPDKPKTASEHRKSSKPIMEKRRRARINESLGQLKTLILDALKKDSSRHSKLEKADILEMTVKHLRNLQRAQMTAALNNDPTVLGKYRAGFSECMNEVTRFLSTCEGVNTEVRTRLLGHLANCMTQINAINYPTQHQIPPTAGPTHPSFGQSMVQIPSSSPQVLPINPCKGAPSPASLPPEATKVYGGFQIVPATDGQFAFLIPNTAFAANGPVIPVYANNVSTPVPVPAAVSPGVPSGNTDSVWRPW